MELTVIIAAGGRSARYSEGEGTGGLGGRSKLDEELGGRPVLQRTVELFAKRDDVAQVIVAGPAEGYDEFVLRHGDKLGLMGVVLCKGGESHRYETVRNALEHVSPSATHIAVHDAARPCTPLDVIERVLEAAREHDAVIPGVDVSDTLKRVSADRVEAGADPLDAILGGAGKTVTGLRRVEETVDRDRLVMGQTPQVFEAGLLRRAYGQDDLSSTDDAGLVERLGEAVMVVEGDPRNIKITRRADMGVARAVLGVSEGRGREAHKRF